MSTVLLTLFGFLSGAVPYSVLIGRFIGKIDIRTVGDQNPGATNVLRAMDAKWFLAAFLLDTLKGAIPVGIAWFVLGVTDWRVLPIAIAPVAGHAFSPFLKGKGGKAVAVTFGVWIGLTAGTAPTLLGLTLGVIFLVIATSGWAVMLTLLSFGGFIWLYYMPQHPVFGGIWLGHLLILGCKHFDEIKQLPALRKKPFQMLAKLLRRKN